MYTHSADSLGIFGIEIPTIRTIIGVAGDVFGGGGRTETGSPVTVLGSVQVCNDGPVPYSALAAAWANAPQSARDQLWVGSGTASHSQSNVRTTGGLSVARDDVRLALIARLANGAGNCKMDDADNVAAAAAVPFVSQWQFAPAAPDSRRTATDPLLAGAEAGTGWNVPLLVGGAALLFALNAAFKGIGNTN